MRLAKIVLALILPMVAQAEVLFGDWVFEPRYDITQVNDSTTSITTFDSDFGYELSSGQINYSVNALEFSGATAAFQSDFMATAVLSVGRWNSRAIATEFEFSQAVIVAYNYRGGSGDSDFQIRGQFTTDLPSIRYSYDGAYIELPSSTLDEYYSPVTIEVDFASGKIAGFDRRKLGVITINGQLDGAVVMGHVRSPSGTMDLAGGIFGPSGEEFLAAADGGGIVAIIAAELDPVRTEIIN